MALSLKILAGSHRGTILRIQRSRVLMGRAKECTLRLISHQISRQHCQLMLHENGKNYLRDLNSSNGTFLNGKRVEREQVIEHGMRLQLGVVTFEILLNDQTVESSLASFSDYDSADAIYELKSNQINKGKSWVWDLRSLEPSSRPTLTLHRTTPKVPVSQDLISIEQHDKDALQETQPWDEEPSSILTSKPFSSPDDPKWNNASLESLKDELLSPDDEADWLAEEIAQQRTRNSTASDGQLDPFEAALNGIYSKKPTTEDLLWLEGIADTDASHALAEMPSGTGTSILTHREAMMLSEMFRQGKENPNQDEF